MIKAKKVATFTSLGFELLSRLDLLRHITACGRDREFGKYYKTKSLNTIKTKYFTLITISSN